ncbi:MAG: alpha/beta hydrolase [Actinomycetia bacterium]|nr:alpha/beta hydrolase [Actinomycetes bacterium]MCP4086121.1 alpha/beta hydrolase [Actinomycetes bacterium]
MIEVEHSTIHGNGINIHYVSKGEGPLVVFCHGWPESWYSWRHQIPAVADAGFRAIAMSMRGYGGTDAPQDVGAYTINHLVGDVVAVVNALGEEDAVVVGHDWGAPVAWYSALMRPDMFRAVAALSVPFIPPIGGLPEGVTMNDMMAQTAGPDRDYYRLFFQEPGRAEADLEADIERTMRGVLYSISGDAIANGDLDEGWDGFFPAGQTMSEQLIIPDELPAWLHEDDLAFYVEEITRTGFRGGFNWYRNINTLPACLAPWVGTTIEQPAFYMGGSTDMIAGNTPEAIEGTRAALPGLRHLEILEGAGHWLQQERPDEVNAALLEFLAGL